MKGTSFRPRHGKKRRVNLVTEAHRLRKHDFVVWVALAGRVRPVVFHQSHVSPGNHGSNIMSFYRPARFSYSDAAVWKTG
jgi:hypothetical protein